MLPLQKVRATPLKKGKLKKGESLVLSPSQVYTYRACLIKQKPNCYTSLVNHHAFGGVEGDPMPHVCATITLKNLSVEISYEAADNDGDEPQHH